MKFTVTDPDRIDKAIAKQLPESRRALTHLFDEGNVRVNGKKVKKGDRVAAGDEVEVIHEAQSPIPVADPEALAKLHVLVETAHYVAIDKPSGMPSQPLRAGELGTAANGIIARWPECAQASLAGDPRDGGLVHRLDIGTSGVLVAARDPETYAALRELFAQHAVDKTYLAITLGRPVSRSCEAPLLQRGKRVVVDDTDGQSAETVFEVVASNATLSLVRCTATTGRMHQVRAHLAHCNAPILGDTLYGAPPAENDEGFFLHAESVGFTLNGERVTITVEPPKRFSLRAPEAE